MYSCTIMMEIIQGHKMSHNARKLTTSRPFSDNFTGCLFMITSTINFFLPHTSQFMEMLVSASMNFFTFTPPLALSDQL